MKFDAFDKAEQEKYTAEVKEKWGNTIAYQEYQQHEKGGATGTPADLMRHFAKLGKLKHLAPTAPEAQAAIRDLQQFITDHFYTCTLEILAGLGEMYVADDRFRKNIDKAGGEGTADFVAQAIAAYCGKKLFFVYSAANFELRLSKDFLHCLTSNVSKSLSLNASRSL